MRREGEGDARRCECDCIERRRRAARPAGEGEWATKEERGCRDGITGESDGFGLASRDGGTTSSDQTTDGGSWAELVAIA
jgi:hypothetical protein